MNTKVNHGLFLTKTIFKNTVQVFKRTNRQNTLTSKFHGDRLLSKKGKYIMYSLYIIWFHLCEINQILDIHTH